VQEDQEADPDDYIEEEEENPPSGSFPEVEKPSQLRRMLGNVLTNKQIDIVFEAFSYAYFKSLMRWFLETATCTVSFQFEDISFMMTLFVLFGDDIKLLSAPREMDHDFSIAYAVCLFAFIFELLANSWAKTEFIQWKPRPKFEGFLFSFFWWLDLVAIFSMFPDVPFIGEPMGVSGISNDVSGGGDNYATAGRVVRLVRLVRLVKLYKVAMEKRHRRQLEEELLELVAVGAIGYEDMERQRQLYSQRQSRLGDQLSESTTRRVIIMILLLLIVLPLLIPTFENEGPEFAVVMLHAFNVDQTVSMAAKQAVLNTFNTSIVDIYHSRIVEYLLVTPLSTNEPEIYFASHLDTLRDEAKLEFDRFTENSDGNFTTDAIFNINELVQSSALLSILTTLFVGILLIVASLVFTNDAQRLVIEPIERMVNMVEAVAEDPLAEYQFDDEDVGTGQYETKLLESTVEKITGLLRVGFGEAGAGIISANLSSKDSSTAINPLLPGIRIYAIFGFCDIHHFEDINQKLSNDVLVFVNTIAEIVHDSVHTWSGQCNKNLGNAFVIVWRIGDEEQLTRNAQRGGRIGRGGGDKDYDVPAPPSTPGQSMKSPGNPRMGVTADQVLASQKAAQGGIAALEGNNEEDEKKKKSSLIDLRRVPGVDVLADHALIGYLKIIAEINRNRTVLKYRSEPRLTDKGKTDYKVRMGFGLHAGWAIEGAVGSLQKVDATYLSPHVNMAARLETSSKQYGVPLLASQDFYDLMTTEGQSRCRKVDVITVKGSEVPIGIYTYDALQEQDFKDDSKRRNQASFADGPRGSSSKDNSNAGAGANGDGVPSAPLTASFPGQSGTGSGTSTPQRRPSVPQNVLSPGYGADGAVKFCTPNDLTSDVFEQDYDLLTLRRHADDPAFMGTFREGVQLYLSGEWAQAKELLESADLMMAQLAPALGGDGPSKTLLSYMRNRNFETPKNWKGFRPLTSK